MADDGMCLSLCELPDIILVRVMSYLTLSDRYSFMQTCQRIYETFKHPSLWYRMELTLKGVYGDAEKDQLAKIQARIDSVGRFCQELEFFFKGEFEKMDDNVGDLIRDLSEKCRLETLIVHADYVSQKHKPRSNFIGPALREDIDTICSVVSRCHRLTSFCIRSWPVFNHTSPEYNEILESLCENEKLLNLEKLHLFWPDRSETTWASVKENQTWQYGLKVVDHFKHLTHLSLMSNVLSEKLIKSLSLGNRTPVSSFRIMVIYKATEHFEIGIPNISNDSWGRLSARSPDIRVEMVFSSRVPSDKMAMILQPALPLSTVHFMKYSRCSPEDVALIAEYYHESLEKYCDETDSNYPSQLIKLLHSCLKLRTLIYHGHINYTTVVQLARIKGKDWYRFEIKGSLIDYDDVIDDVDEDVVIGKNKEGELYLVDVHKWGDTEESLDMKDLRILETNQIVSEILGYKWNPV